MLFYVSKKKTNIPVKLEVVLYSKLINILKCTEMNRFCSASDSDIDALKQASSSKKHQKINIKLNKDT